VPGEIAGLCVHVPQIIGSAARLVSSKDPQSPSCSDHGGVGVAGEWVAGHCGLDPKAADLSGDIPQVVGPASCCIAAMQPEFARRPGDAGVPTTRWQAAIRWRPVSPLIGLVVIVVEALLFSCVLSTKDQDLASVGDRRAVPVERWRASSESIRDLHPLRIRSCSRNGEPNGANGEMHPYNE